jgi:hypothetical protein
MSCELLIGRTEPCKDSIGGLKAVYFFNEEPTVTYYTNDWNVEFIPLMAPQFHDMVFWVDQQVLNIKLKKQDATTHKYLKLLAYGKVRVVVENNNNQLFLMGVKFGAEVTGGSITSGGALQDHNGYTLTLTSEELKPAPFLAQTLINTEFPNYGVFRDGVLITDNSLVD